VHRSRYGSHNHISDLKVVLGKEEMGQELRILFRYHGFDKFVSVSDFMARCLPTGLEVGH
jgi:hypothetical protein